MENVAWRVAELERWRSQIEELKPEVMSEQIKNLVGEVRSLRRALTTFSLSIVASAVIFTFSVLLLLKK